MGIAGDDDRGAGDGGPDGRRAVARGVGGVGDAACWRSGAAISGSRISTASPRTASALPMALPATSSRSPEAVSSTLRAEARSSSARIATLEKYAQHEDGLCQWPPALEPPGSPTGDPARSGATARPGMVASLATMAPDDERLTELLLGGGELTWLRRPAPEGRPALPRHRRQRVRVPEAVRAHRRRALARRARGSRCTRSSRSRAGGARPRPPHALDGDLGTAVSPELPRRHAACRRSTTSRARRESRPTPRARRRRGSPERPQVTRRILRLVLPLAVLEVGRLHQDLRAARARSGRRVHPHHHRCVTSPARGGRWSFRTSRRSRAPSPTLSCERWLSPMRTARRTRTPSRARQPPPGRPGTSTGRRLPTGSSDWASAGQEPEQERIDLVGPLQARQVRRTGDGFEPGTADRGSQRARRCPACRRCPRRPRSRASGSARRRAAR